MRVIHGMAEQVNKTGNYIRKSLLVLAGVSLIMLFGISCDDTNPADGGNFAMFNHYRSV
jgi:hypothetical protein